MKRFKIVIVFIVFSIFFLYSCTIFNPKPKNVLSEKRLVELLTDLYITDSYIHFSNDSLIKKNSYDTTWNRAFFSNVFEKHNANPDQLKESLLYYSTKLKTIELIYDKVIENLSTKEAELQKKVTE